MVDGVGLEPVDEGLVVLDRLSHLVSDIRIQNLKELRAPLRLTIQWEARRAVRSEQGALRLALPTVIESQFLSPDTGSDDSDSLPLQLRSALTLRSETTLHLPPGHTLSPAALTPDHADAPFGSCSLSVSPPDAKRETRLTWQCILKPVVLDPDKKRAFTDFTHDSLRKLQGDWEFTPETVVKK